MSPSNFRVKLDLSKFYDDVRRSSWIYVDKGSISRVCHLQKHITKVFDLQRSFHLLLNTGEYLPPNEDARILKEEETILVVPGTGLQQNTSNPQTAAPNVPRTSNGVVRQQKPCVPSDSIVSLKGEEDAWPIEEDLTTPLETTGENTLFLSVINEFQLEAESESRADLSTLGESVISDSSPSKNKRKRVRRKKSKKVTLQEEEPVAGSSEVQIEYKKPKIINTVTVTNGNHIRFGDIEKLELQGYESSTSNDSKKHDFKTSKNSVQDSHQDKPTAGLSLSNLLALRQSSTPITFGRKRIEDNNMSQRNIVKNEIKEIAIEEEEVSNRNGNGLNADLKEYPLMETKAKYKDIIAFKMLKMGSDYTPQISEYIIAKPIQILSDGSTYVFKILEGRGEIQAPQGKFDMELEEAMNTETDLISLNWSQLIEPRLLHRA